MPDARTLGPRVALDRIDRVALALVAPLVALAVLRALPLEDRYPLVGIEAELGWLLAPAWLVLALEILRRRAPVAAIAAIPCLVHASLVVPLAAPRAHAGDEHAARIRLVTANLNAWQEHPQELARELATFDADVMVLEELTPEWVSALEDAGVLAAFDRDASVVAARDGCFGIAILSRFPRIEHELIERDEIPRIRARFRIADRAVTILAVHTMPPITAEYARWWSDEVREVRGDVAESEDPTIVAGDLNATPFGRAYASLEDAGLRGAHELAGRGLATTWPNGQRWIPPMRLDHVLVSGEIDALAVREGIGAGSDHRPVIADLAIRLGS